ncbi:hypothetical protein [Ornithinimicrobium avium]|uniref:Uncharacterized protein n=1 Tax=Ornithinimicrobium avium TaxID=2283195 RepID=A0A345NKZ3_9MICO|nr:hypothetical protein [Ornithinimicrobium avium]AXH95701.1 hypothetical protein DV701_05815 [Ornithinimicrobium avium]
MSGTTEQGGTPVSSTDEDARGGGDERPMLILGEDLPDVEDTTPEELRRQQEEAEREIAEARRRAQEEIERRRREAEKEIAALEQQKERELAARQRELDDTQRTLFEREAKLRRTVTASGGTPEERLVSKVARPPLSQRGLRRSGRVVGLATAAAAALAVGLLTAVPGGGPDVRAEIDDADRARVVWLRSGSAADEQIARRMAGQDVPTGADGTYENVRLAREAGEIYAADRYVERTEENTATMLAADTSEVRSLTLWNELHDTAGYAVGSWEVEDIVEDSRGPGAWTYVLLAVGVLGLAALAVLALVARSWVSLPVLVVATGLAVAALSAVAAHDAAVGATAAAHEAADDAVDDLYDQVGRDLRVAYGITTSSYDRRPEFWTDDPFYGEDQAPGTEAYLAVREDMAGAMEQGEEATEQKALELVQAAREGMEARGPAVGRARADLLAALERSGSRWGLAAGLGAGAAVLGGLGVALSRGRGRTP